MGIGRKGFLFAVFFLLANGVAKSILSVIPTETIQAAVMVSSYKELKKELEAPGKAEIDLKSSLVIEDTLYVKGDKSLNGNGYTLSRLHRGGEVFGGTLLVVQEGQLSVHDTILSGGGKDAKVQKKVYGRLMDVQGGEVILESGSVLRENVNQRYNNDGGGAVLVQSGGRLTMNGGEISENQNVFGGAGVHIRQGGNFVMKGGTISGNQSFGIGAVEGFDGRGGAIYNQGKTTISGGSICHNRVKGYTSGGISYGGVGGMLYNQGECCIQGGNLADNSASYGGGAIYSDQGSKLQIMGGMISGNEADLGEGLFLAGGRCRMGGFFYLPSVYLAKGVVLTAEDSLSLKKHQILISPEKYKAGVQLVKIQGKKPALREMFSLERKDTFTLVLQNRGLYIGKKEKPLSGTSSKTTKRVKKTIKKPAGRSEKDSKEGSVDQSGRKISIRSAPRYLFVGEVGSYTEEKWREELLEGCKIWYGDQKKEEIILQWHWNGLLQNSPGSYQVEVSVEGGDRTVIPVTLVQESAEEQKAGYVRFQIPDTQYEASVEKGEYGPEEVWHFESQDIKDAREFMKGRGDPFSSETNKEFLVRFQRCQIKRRS